MIPRFFWNAEEKRLRAFWRLLLQLVLLLALLFTFTGSVSLVTYLISSLLGGLANPLNRLPIAVIQSILGLAACSAILLSVFLAGRWFDRRPFFDFGFHFNLAWCKDFCFGLFLGAFLMTAIYLVELAAGWAVPIDRWVSLDTGSSITTGLFQSALFFIFVGVYEETFARGYLLRNLAEGLKLPFFSTRTALVLAWILSSAVFSLLHIFNPGASIISTLNLILAGLFLGFGYLLTGELAIPIGLHITWNFFQGNVFGFPVSGTDSPATIIAIQQKGPEIITGGSFGPEAGLVGIAAMLTGSLMIYFWVQKRYGKAQLQECLALYRTAEMAKELP